MSEEISRKKLRVDDNDNKTNLKVNPEDIASTVPFNEENSFHTLSTAAEAQQKPKLTFKNPNFSYIEPGGKKFVWKSLKQIVAQEKSLPWPDEVVLCKIYIYNSINAPPSLKPPKKYSDISGLEAPYCDPQTKLYYHNAEEFRIVRTLPSDIVQGYLALRGATNIVG